MSEIERALARIQALSCSAWCDMQGRLQDETHRRAHAALEHINADASAAIAAWNRRTQEDE